MTDPRYPIGRPEGRGALAPAERARAIDGIAALPAALRAAVQDLDDAALDTPYRDGGWTLRQVVHHLADSHVNAYVRHKLTIAERAPTLQAYDEAAWARMPDANGPIDVSLRIVTAIHERWAACLRAQPAAVFANAARHTERGAMTLDDLVREYDWHGRHHVAQITTLRRARGW